MKTTIYTCRPMSTRNSNTEAPQLLSEHPRWHMTVAPLMGHLVCLASSWSVPGPRETHGACMYVPQVHSSDLPSSLDGP